MPKIPIIKANKLIKALSEMGFQLVWQKGSHKIFKHPDGRRTTIPVPSGKTIPKGLLSKIANEMRVDLAKQGW
ncbi:MAG: type II toxin-antitoxin system HicA family toxin [Methanosarcinales archaeon]